jgi:ubiquitin-conjugating enzyme E2 M
MLTALLDQKQKQQQAENAEGAAGKKKKKVTAAQLRVQRGMPPPRTLWSNQVG